MTISELMDGLSAGLEGETLEPDADGIYRIDVDGVVVAMTEKPEENVLLLWSEIGQVPENYQARYYRGLLEGMFFDKGTGGAVFSCNAEDDTILMHKRLYLSELDVEQLGREVCAFCEMVEKWREVTDDFIRGNVDFPEEDEDEDLEAPPAPTKGDFSGGDFMRV